MFHLLQFHLQEMADSRLRGTLSAGIPLTQYIGSVLISPIFYSIGWKMSAGLVACIALIDLVFYSFLHESPVWYVRKNRISSARKVFSWLWGYGHHVQVRLTHSIYIFRTGDTLQQVTLLFFISSICNVCQHCIKFHFIHCVIKPVRENKVFSNQITVATVTTSLHILKSFF